MNNLIREETKEGNDNKSSHENRKVKFLSFIKSNKIILITFLIQAIGLLLLTYYVTGTDFFKFSKFLQALILLDIAFLFKNKFSKFVCLICLLIIDFQLTNYLAAGDFITTEALLNLKEISSIGTLTTIKLSLFLVFVIILFLLNIIISPIKKAKFPVIIIFLLLVIFSKPIYEFYKTLNNVYEIMTFEPNIEYAEEFKHNTNKIGNSPVLGKNMNVILIFAEGFSDCVISSEFTPNLYNLCKKSIRVTNYYNHTYPTFRGIRGSNISGYQLHELEWVTSMENYYKNFNTISLPMILDKNGYKTIFVSPHNKHGQFSKLLNVVGYKEIDAPEDTDGQDDKTTLEQLFAQIDYCKKNNQKFIVSTYLLGTHLGLDSPHQKYGDGKNVFLNKFFNQDYYFGKFLENLEANDYLNDTLLIFTADHAAYPAPDFKKSFNSKSNEMVDKIPLIIYKKDIIAKEYDANNRNSLSLAPTIINILDINNQENYFLGNSLFCDETSEWQYISTTGHRIFSTKNGKVEVIKLNQTLKEKLIKFFKTFG